MNRSAIRKTAVWARTSLVEQITARATALGISKDGIVEAKAVQGGLIAGDVILDASDTALYERLRAHLTELQRTERTLAAAVSALVNEVAYTWFNRFTALRFMEVSGYIAHTVGSSDPSLRDPDLLRDAVTLSADGDLPGVTLARLEEWQRAYDTEGVYRRLLVARCESLAAGLPFLFGADLNYTALFLPPFLLNNDSLLRRLERDIPTEDWAQIEIVGWLYQFYISEEKDRVIGSGKYAARDIPAATQLFTPNWIVQYMVQNSLGRTWLEAHPTSTLADAMPYYLRDTNPPPPANPALQPQDLTVLDPACGSGHILVYAFDLLFTIYAERGYADADIPIEILTHNLHGLDIDPRAAQLACFAVTMKARAVNRRILRDPPALHIRAIAPTRAVRLEESPATPASQPDLFKRTQPQQLWTAAINPRDWQPLIDAFKDADSLGSLISPPDFDDAKLQAQLNALRDSGSLVTETLLPELTALLNDARLLQKRYMAVIANPPYMGNSYMNDTLKDFAKAHYPTVKSDLFAVFIARCLKWCKPESQLGFMSPFTWMFISSYEELRALLTKNHTITSLVQLEYSGFDGATVPICTFTVSAKHLSDFKGEYVRLSDFKGADVQGPKVMAAVANPQCGYRFSADARAFEKIPGSPIAYWASQKVLEAFEKGTRLEEIGVPRQGLATGENDRFVRAWFEPAFENIGFNYSSRDEARGSRKKWFPYNKGGEFRKWYGNNDLLINWQDDGREIDEFKPRAVVRNPDTYFRDSITWSFVSSAYFGVRSSDRGFVYDVGGSSLFSSEKDKPWILTLMCSNVVSLMMKYLNPTLNFQVGNVADIPVPKNEMRHLATEIASTAVSISRADWDNFETSWDFQTHPLLRGSHASVAAAFADWARASDAAFTELQRLETENNRYWIAAYNLQDELTSAVPDDQITIRRADRPRDTRSLISYAVGCVMGRYSLDALGLQYAGGDWNADAYTRFQPDADGIVPVMDSAYVDDDLAARVTEFLRVAFGASTLSANLEFIADGLGRKKSETASATLRRYLLEDFITDHIKVYKRRPIYWLFTSGKARGFSALVYLHRMTPDTLSRMRLDYVLESQTRLETALQQAAGRDAARLQAQTAEIRAFEAKLRKHTEGRVRIDLDDGVAYNYTLFEGLLYEGPELKMVDMKKKSEWKRELLRREASA